MNEIIAIIPARGGSKGLPKKNIKDLNGKPLINYTIDSAIDSKVFTKIIVSTDDDEIALKSDREGVKVIKRPADLATDESDVLDTILQIVNYEFTLVDSDTIVLLQPTSPLRNYKDIRNSLELFKGKNCDTVVSISKCAHPPQWNYKVVNNFLIPMFKDGLKRRQDGDNWYTLNGAIYITSVKILHKYKSFLKGKVKPYMMPPERSVDIDQEIDLELCKLILKKEMVR